MKMTLHEGSDKLHVVLEGDMTIESGTELRDRFIDILEQVKDMEVDLSSVRSTDISFWQLISSVGKTAEAMGLRYTLSKGLPEQVNKFLGDYGLDHADHFGNF
ncbi:MAG: STAS domain-containing protein [Desulfovibrionales bacterium]